MKRTFKILVKVIILAALLTAYLNIGWGFGGYIDNIQTKKELTAFQKFICGPNRSFIDQKELSDNQKLWGNILGSVFWPLFAIVALVVVCCMWLIYGCYLGVLWAGNMAWIILKFLLWFIFAGGFMKLVGFC
jgi:hypothetical protein